MKHIFTYLAFLCLFGSFPTVNVWAQQDPQFSQYMHNKLFMNPAYAGMKHALCFTGIVREQWSGFEGSPRSGVLSGDIYLEKIHGGIGLNLMYDQLGFERNLAYRFNYSFHIEEILGGTLGIGIEAGGTSKTIGPTGSQSWIATTNWVNDPTVPPQMKSSKADFGAGIWFERDDVWFGLSTSHLNGGRYNSGPAAVGNSPVMHSLLYEVAHHYWITGGYHFQTRAWRISPSFLLKSDAVVTTFDLNCTATLNDKVWFGVSYRYQDAVCPMIGFNWISKPQKTENLDPTKHDRSRTGKQKPVQTMRIGFAYDYTTSKLNQHSNGTFELFVNYCIPWEPRTGGGGDVRIFE